MLRTLILITVVAIFCACAGSHKKASSKDSSKSTRTAMGRTDDGSKCDPSKGRESLADLNQDGQSDVRRIYKSIGDTEILICREADNNFDGKKDIFVFFDNSGNITRDEVDLDYDRKIDIISLYANGKATKQEIDTNSDGFVDRIRYLKDDLPVRVEGDTNNDGQVDLWEYYAEGVLVRLGTDNDGDGRVDTWSRDAAALKEKEQDSQPSDKTPDRETTKPEQKDGSAAKGEETVAKPNVNSAASKKESEPSQETASSVNNATGKPGEKTSAAPKDKNNDTKKDKADK